MKKITVTTIFDCTEEEAQAIVKRVTDSLAITPYHDTLIDFSISVTTEYSVMRSPDNDTYELKERV